MKTMDHDFEDIFEERVSSDFVYRYDREYGLERNKDASIFGGLNKKFNQLIVRSAYLVLLFQF